MSATPFALYPTRSCVPAQRVNAGASFALDVPAGGAGAQVFRHSLWLPVPAVAGTAEALRLVASALKVRFTAASFTVVTGSTDWFSKTQTTDNQTVRLEFVWPATVTRIHSPAGFDRLDIALHRADGEQVIEEATQTARTDSTLAPPWVGTPLVIRLAHPIVPNRAKRAIKMTGNIRSRAAAGPVHGNASAFDELEQEIGNIGALITQVVQSDIVPAITIAGKPTSPRLRLTLESLAGAREVMLWQALVPGEQGSTELPAKPLAEEWTGALEQVHKALSAIAEPPPAVLRLDIESDAPCAISLQQAGFGLEGDFSLLDEPLRFDFDGARAITHALELTSPPPGTGAIVLEGLLDGADSPGAAGQALPAGGRTGVLLEPDQSAMRSLALAAPASLAGLAIAWHPLSDRIAGTLRVFADGGNGPAARPLVEVPFAIDTAGPGWIAVRWAALDLQPQPLWLRLSLVEGGGIWLADPADAAVSGWHERLAAPAGARTPLGLVPLCAWLDLPPGGGNPAGNLSFVAGGQTLSPLRDGGRFSVELPGAPIEVSCAAPARLIVENAHATVRIA